jgi:DNA-binding winged helix-turn-helix (wHTH) protein
VEARFGAFSFDDGPRELRCGSQLVHLSPKAFDLLAALLRGRPGAVSKTDLHSTLWPDTFVTDGSLAVLITELRRALGDSAHRPTFIRTVNRFGYAFVGDERVEQPPHDSTCYLEWGSVRARLKNGESLIGRDPHADIYLEAVGVSRRHACIELRDGGAVLRDLGSKNGTFLDGVRVTSPTLLRDGVEFRLGAILVVFRQMPLPLPTQTVDGSTIAGESQ